MGALISKLRIDRRLVERLGRWRAAGAHAGNEHWLRMASAAWQRALAGVQLLVQCRKGTRHGTDDCIHRGLARAVVRLCMGADCVGPDTGSEWHALWLLYRGWEKINGALM